MKRRSGGLVLVEEIADEQEHVHFVVSSQLQDFLERLDGVPTSHWISLIVADVIVCRYQDLR